MQRRLVFLLGCVAVLPLSRSAEVRFSQAVRPGEFSAAGLEKISAADLARLDTLVRDFKRGALETARREATVAQRVCVDAEARAAQTETDARSTA